MKSGVHTPSPPSSPEANFSFSDVEGEFSDVTIALSSGSEDNLSKPKKTKITHYFKPCSSSILSYVHGSSRSSQQTSPPVQAGQKANLSTNDLANDEPSSIATEVSSSKSSKMWKAAYTTYSF